MAVSCCSLRCSGLCLPSLASTPPRARTEETVNAANNVPKGILRSVLLSGIFGFIMVASFVIALPGVADGAKQGGTFSFG